MGDFLMLIVGIVFIVIGIINYKGNVSTVHSYHRNRVTEEDKPKFAKLIGIGTIICGIGLMAGFSFSFFTENSFEFVLIPFLIVGIVFQLYAIIKYNKGLF